ncbi:MAG: 2-hydroxyhepta-2,4-diene-1,7-dioate isomerase, partial [Gammaproteobacteria bacterium]|nr:2-hydroxyhepta-2,4-diene-1,7-dioate isomerase [Gammaproteobacteria bacterium]
MKLYKTTEGALFCIDNIFYHSPEQNWDALLAHDDLYSFLSKSTSSLKPLAGFSLKESTLLAPIQSQEVWGAGVTYSRSKSARMEESPGGANFYDKIYDAQRPELFFKATPHRVIGTGHAVRIRK